MDFLQRGFTGYNTIWLYVLTMVLVFLGIQVASIPLIIAAFSTVDFDMSRFLKGAESSFMDIGMNSSLYLFLMIFTFAVAIWVLFLCLKYFHKKKFISIITSRKKIDWQRVFYAFSVWGLISIVFIFIGIFLSPEDYTWNFKLIPFTILLLVSLLFLPFQTSAEELVFRGYLMQGFAILAKNRWFPLLMTSVIFGLLHGMNPEVEKLGYITMVFYIGTGLLFGIITLMDEGIELALGLHASNNIVAAFLVSTDWTVFQTDALYIDTSEPSVGLEMFFPVLVLYPMLLFVFSKKYSWKNWKEKLFGSVEKPVAKEVN
mgnify:FL=1